jgi:hypothetical protein
MNTALKIGLGIGAAVAINRILQLGKLAGSVSVSLSKVRVHKVSLAGLELAVTAKINNPTSVMVTILNPIVRLWDSKGYKIAESIATGQSFPVNANRQSEVGEIMLPLSWGAVLPLLGIKNVNSVIQLFGKDGTAGLLKALSSPISMSVVLQADGITIETPKTIINK